MSSAIPFELVLVSVAMFVAVLVFLWIHDRFKLPKLGMESDEPFFETSEPNRRNQSSTPPSADIV